MIHVGLGSQQPFIHRYRAHGGIPISSINNDGARMENIINKRKLNRCSSAFAPTHTKLKRIKKTKFEEKNVLSMDGGAALAISYQIGCYHRKWHRTFRIQSEQVEILKWGPWYFEGAFVRCNIFNCNNT